jgi:hypothetical protein
VVCARPAESSAAEAVGAVTNSPYPDPQNGPAPLPADERSAPAELSTLQRSVDILVSGLIGVYDLSTSSAVQTEIAQVLARVNVERVEVLPGTAFDPSRFEAVSTVMSGDPTHHQRVAQTLRPGWRGVDAVLRSPQVSVWVADPSAPPSAAGPDANGGQ